MRPALLAALAAALAASAAAAPPAARPASARIAPDRQPLVPGKYVVRQVDDGSLWLDPPALPDLSGYTDAAVEAKIPRGAAGHARIGRMVDSPTLHEFVGGHNRLAEWARRQHTNPQAIFIEGGLMRPADLARALTREQFEQVGPGVFLAKLPIVVQQGAAFHVGPDTRELRLSEEHGAFIVNDGLLFVTHSRVTGWRDANRGPARFRAPGDFRPFIASWGGAELYIAGSVLTSLGYEASKSFGVAISQYSPNMDARLKRKRPTGWIINSQFDDLYYGFYCYQADNVAVVNNTYRGSAVYGIDPHDYSRHLIIAHNTIENAHKKHGLIVSRGVDDSFLLWNRISGSGLSGIVLDRNSSRNVVAYNDVIGNHGDGITIYESPNNLIWNNRASNNDHHGIRLRNSTEIKLYGNIAIANGRSGIYGHVKDLAGMDRNLKIDPYEAKISMVVVGGQLIFNGSGPLSIDRPLSLELYGVDMLAPTKKAGIQLSGVLGEYQQTVLDILVRQRGAVLVEPVERNAARAQEES